ncbi:MAG: hypothetical protein ACYC8W_04695 [Candidatus Tyrphobacter sp.]
MIASHTLKQFHRPRLQPWRRFGIIVALLASLALATWSTARAADMCKQTHIDFINQTTTPIAISLDGIRKPLAPRGNLTLDLDPGTHHLVVTAGRYTNPYTGTIISSSSAFTFATVRHYDMYDYTECGISLASRSGPPSQGNFCGLVQVPTEC